MRVLHNGHRRIAHKWPHNQALLDKGHVKTISFKNSQLSVPVHAIRISGGQVIGSIMLVNAGRVKTFTPPRKHVRLLEERFGNGIRSTFGIHPQALTANEAGYLVGFKTLDEIRNRCAKAEKETNLRLLSKGIG